MKRRPSFPSWLIGAIAAAVLVGAVATALTLAGPGTGPVAISSAPRGPSGAQMTSSAAGPPLPSSPATTAAATTPTTSAIRATGAGRPAGPATTATPARRPAAPAPSSPATTATTVPPPANPGPAPAAPGTYRYRQAGSLPGTPAEGTLVVAPAAPGGAQTWTRSVGGPVAPSVTVMLFNASGAYLMAPGASAAGAQASCTFATPLPWPVWPTTPGRSVSGHAVCSGAVSSYQVTGVVQGMATLLLDGHPVATAVVVNSIVMTGSVNGGPLNVTLTETDYYAPTLRVPVETQTHIAGSVMGLSVTTDRTDTLESATPS